ARYGTRHRFIVVQLPEELEAALQGATGATKKTIQAAINLLRRNKRPPLLSELSKERIRRAGQRYRDVDGSLDTGFRSLWIDSSNMAEVYYRPDELKQDDLLNQVDNIRPGRAAEDLLFQVLLDWGVDLALPIAREQ